MASSGDVKIWLGIDIDAIYALGDKWIAFGDMLGERADSMTGGVASMSWSGQAASAMQVLWGTGDSAGASSPADYGGPILGNLLKARDAAYAVGGAINYYGDQLSAAVDKMKKEAILDIILQIVGLATMIIPFTRFGAAVFSAADKILSSVISDLVSVLAKTAGLGAKAAAKVGGFAGGAISGAAVNTGLDLVPQAIGHAIIGDHDWKPEPWGPAVAAGLGAGMGGVFGAHGAGRGGGFDGVKVGGDAPPVGKTPDIGGTGKVPRPGAVTVPGGGRASVRVPGPVNSAGFHEVSGTGGVGAEFRSGGPAAVGHEAPSAIPAGSRGAAPETVGRPNPSGSDAVPRPAGEEPATAVRAGTPRPETAEFNAGRAAAPPPSERVPAVGRVAPGGAEGRVAAPPPGERAPAVNRVEPGGPEGRVAAPPPGERAPAVGRVGPGGPEGRVAAPPPGERAPAVGRVGPGGVEGRVAAPPPGERAPAVNRAAPGGPEGRTAAPPPDERVPAVGRAAPGGPEGRVGGPPPTERTPSPGQAVPGGSTPRPGAAAPARPATADAPGSARSAVPAVPARGDAQRPTGQAPPADAEDAGARGTGTVSGGVAANGGGGPRTPMGNPAAEPAAGRPASGNAAFEHDAAVAVDRSGPATSADGGPVPPASARAGAGKSASAVESGPNAAAESAIGPPGARPADVARGAGPRGEEAVAPARTGPPGARPADVARGAGPHGDEAVAPARTGSPGTRPADVARGAGPHGDEAVAPAKTGPSGSRPADVARAAGPRDDEAVAPAASADGGPVPPGSVRAGAGKSASAVESGPNAAVESAIGPPGSRPADVARGAGPHGDEAVAPAGSGRTPLPKAPDRVTAGPGVKAEGPGAGPGGPKVPSSQRSPSRAPGETAQDSGFGEDTTAGAVRPHEPPTGEAGPAKTDSAPATPHDEHGVSAEKAGSATEHGTPAELSRGDAGSPRADSAEPKTAVGDGPAAPPPARSEPPNDRPATGHDDTRAEAGAEAKAPSDRALDKMVERATGKVEAQEAKAAAARAARAKANRSAHEVRRDQRQEQFDKEQLEQNLPVRKLTPHEHADRALQEAHAKEKVNGAGKGKPETVAPKKSALTPEQEVKARVRRQERFEQEQRAAGADDQDLRQLTEEQHKKLGELERQMDAARARENSARQTVEKAGTPTPKSEPVTSESVRSGADEGPGHSDADSSATPAERALNTMVERAAGKVKAQEARAAEWEGKAAEVKKAAAEAAFRATPRGRRQEQFDKERAEQGLKPRKLTPQEHADRVVQEAHAREDANAAGKGKPAAAASKKSARAAEQEKAKAARQDRFEQEQRAAGAGEQDVRELTEAEHKKLGELEQRMNAARAKEKAALQKLEKAGKPEPPTGEPARSGADEGPGQTHADSSATPAERALGKMVERATAKVEAREAKADAAAKAGRSAHEIRRDQRQERFDKERADGGLEPRKLTPQEHAERALQEAYAREKTNVAGSGESKAPSAEKTAHAAEQEKKTQAWRQERFEREQRAAGVGEEDLRQLTPEEHKKLGELEQRMNAARAKEKTALQKLEKAGKPAPEAEPATGEPARGADQTHGEPTPDAEPSAKAPSDRALGKMVERATAKVEAREAKADAAAKAGRSAHEIRRDQRQERFDKERADGGLEPRKLTPQEHAERVVQEAHAREDGNGRSTAAASEKSARAAEQEAKAKAWRQERYEQRQKAAGAADDDLRQLTTEEHTELAGLEQRMDIARAREKVAQAKLEKMQKAGSANGEERPATDTGNGAAPSEAKNAAEPSDDGLVRNGTSDDAVSSDAPADAESATKTPAERALDDMRQRATAKVEAQEAKAAAAAKASRSAHEIRRDQRQERFDKERADGGLEPRKLTPQEHADRIVQETHAREDANAAGKGKPEATSAEKAAHAAEQEAKAKAWRQERFEQEQRAAGAGEEDLRQLTPEEHKKLGELERRMDAARAEEKTARQKLQKAGKAEPATGEPARAEERPQGETTTGADSSATPAERALDKMVERATAKVKAQETKASAATKAARSAHEIRRDQRQERFDKEQVDGGLEPRKLTPQEHAERVVQEAHAREDRNGKSTASRQQKPGQEQWAEGAEATDVTSPAGVRRPGPQDHNAETRQRADKFEELLRHKRENATSTGTASESSAAGPAAGRAAPANPTRQLFRTDLKTREMHLVEVVRGDRLGKAGPAEEDRADADADAGGAKASGQYEYREIAPGTRTAVETRLGPNEVVVSAKPARGQEHGAFAYKKGQRIPIGDPAERLAVFDHAAGTWDVATVNHKPGGATSEQSHQVSGPRAGEPALPKEDVKPVQILRRDGDGNIDLLTYERPPENVRLPGGGKSDGFKYHGLAKDDPKGWHNRTPLGTPKVERLVTAPKANRLSGKPIADRTSSAIVRDPKTGLYEKLTEVSSGAKAGPTGPGKSYYRIKDDGTLERVTFKVERLDVVKVRADGTVAHTKWAASGKGNAAPVLDKDGSLTSSSSRKPSIDELRYDKVSGQIIRAEDTHARGPDGGGGSGDGPGGGKGFGTRSKSAGGQTENVVETYTEERPATDTATAAKPAEKGEDRPAANKDKLPGKGRFPGKGKPPGESPARPDNKARADGFKKLIGRSGPGPGSGSGDGAGSGGGGGSQRVRAGDGSSTTTEHPDAPATGGPAEEHTGGPGAATDRPDAGPGGTDRPAADHDAATRPYDAAHGEPKVGGEGPVKTPSDREPPADHDAATRPYDAAHGEPKVGGEASAKTPSDPEPPATGERPTVKPEAQRTKTDAAPDSAATDDRPAQEVPREQRQEKLDKEPDERGLPQRTSTPKEHPDRTGQEPPTRDRANAGGTGEPKAAAPRKPEAAAPKKPEAAAPRKPTRTPDQLRQAAIHRQERFTQEQRAEGVREEDLRELTPEEHAKLADLEERMDAARAEEKAALQAVPKTEAAGTRTASAAEAVGGDTPKTADAVSVEVSPSADEKAVPQEVPKADAVGSRVEPVAEAGGGDTLKTADAAGTRTEAAVDAVGGDTSKTGGAAGAETSPSADGVAAPAREPLGRQVLDDAAQTLTLVGRVDDAVARQLRADGRILARHFAGLPGAARLSPAESAHVDEVFGAELAWAGFEGASRFGERLFGVDGGLLPSSAVLDGVRERATLDPRRADAVLSLRLGSDRYRDAALQLLNQLHDDSAAVSPDAIRVVAARIAQNSISDVVAEAGRPLAADLLDGTSQTLPYEPRDHEPRDHEAATPPVRGESETAVHQALTTVWPLSADASAQIWAEAGAIVRETAEPAQVSGLKAYLQEDFKPRLLVAAELTGGGPDAARALARAFATGGESAGRVVGGPVSDQATMLLLQGVVWRIQTALQALGEEPDLLASLAGQADDVLEQLGLPPGHVLAAAGFLVGGETVDGRSPSQAVDDLVQALTGETEIGKTDEAVPDAADLDAPRKTPGEQPGLAHLETHHPQAGKRPAERGRGPARKGKPRPAEPAGDDAASVRRRHDGGQAGRPTEDTVHAADRTEAAPDGVEPVRPDPTDLRAARRLLNEQPRAQSERAKREARKIVQGLGGRAATTAPGSADPDADHLRVGLLVAAWIVRTGGEGADEFARSLMPDRSAAPGAPGVPADGLDWQGSSHSAGPYCVQAALVHRGS